MLEKIEIRERCGGEKKRKKEKKRNGWMIDRKNGKIKFRSISTIFLQEILSNRFLLTNIGELKNNFSDGFKLELVTTFHIRF